jgi:hypothetical protein
MIVIGYILKVQIVFTILFLVYYAFLRKEKFLALNRGILISILAAALALPASRTFNINGFDLSRLQPKFKTAGTFPRFASKDLSPDTPTPIATSVSWMDYAGLALIVYFIVSAVLLAIFLAALYKVGTVIRTSGRHKAGGLTYCTPCYTIAPFSFFRFIVVTKIDFSPDEYRQIVIHESAHARQLHSIDVLLADMACILLWVNPLIYLYRRQLKLNLEFLADDAALRSGVDARGYQLSLLQHSGIVTGPMVNAFFTSKIKARIVMINTARPGVRNGCKYLLLVPVALLLSALVGFRKGQPVPDIQVPRLVRQLKPAQRDLNVYIDARTDTVKFSLAPDSTGRRFQGIYVIDDKIFSDDEIRAAIRPTGQLVMILPNRPVLGTYSANDSSAVKKWGERARAGVVFVRARPDTPNR